MKKIFFIIMLLSILSCSISKNTVVGRYGFKGQNTTDLIIVKKDNTYVHKIFNKKKEIMYIGESRYELDSDRIEFFDFYPNEDYELTEFFTSEQASKFFMTISCPVYKENQQVIIEMNADENIKYYKK